MNVRRIISQDSHRNGISGARAVISLFMAKGHRDRFLAISIEPDRPYNEVRPRADEDPKDAYVRAWLDDFATHTVVLNVAETVKGNIGFGKGNSWRGADEYGIELAKAWRAKQQSDPDYPYDPATERYENDTAPPDVPPGVTSDIMAWLDPAPTEGV